MFFNHIATPPFFFFVFQPHQRKKEEKKVEKCIIVYGSRLMTHARLPFLFSSSSCLHAQYFFIFVEGMGLLLHTSSRVEEVPRDARWEPTKDLENARSKSRIWGEKWLSNFFNKPCNNELFVRRASTWRYRSPRRRGEDRLAHSHRHGRAQPGGHGQLSVKTLFANIPETLIPSSFQTTR